VQGSPLAPPAVAAPVGPRPFCLQAGRAMSYQGATRGGTSPVAPLSMSYVGEGNAQMKRHAGFAVVLLLLLGSLALGAQALDYMKLFTDEERHRPHVLATSREVQHDFVDGQWEGIIAASDGKTYFSFSSHGPATNAQFYRYDPKADKVEHLIDVGAWCGEAKDVGTYNTQGKIHSTIYEAGGKLYCSTCPAHRVPDRPYVGGHFLSYDLKTGEFKDLGMVPGEGGGLLTMLYEPVNRRLYAIAQQQQTLYYYELGAGKIVKVGSVEDNLHQCRVLISDERGNVYGSTWDRMIYKYDPASNEMSCLLTRLPHDPKAPQPKRDPKALAWQSTHWTNIVWDPATKWWYGVMGHDEYLFRLRLPEAGSHRAQVEGLAQFGFRPSEIQPRFASLGLALKGRTLYYCSYPIWQAEAHLMSYDIDTGKVTDHGPIVCEGGRRVSEIHSMVVGSDGALHCAAMVWSIEGKDPTKPWCNRAQCYFHARFLKIDPAKDFKTPQKKE